MINPIRPLFVDPPQSERTEPSTCYACKEPSADLKVDSFYKEPCCPKCFGEVEEMERDNQMPVFHAMCHSLELGWTLNQMVAVFKMERGL